MAFHRLNDPTYFGGLPVGYDKINDPADPSVGGSGVPAVADGKKSGGPNDGTYFVAFGEDGQSAFANRPAVALAENTDLLDDILRTSIPTITNVDATAVGAVSSIALVGEIFVGNNGTANNQTNRDKIVRITDQNNNDLEVSGSKIVVTLMHDGASVNVVGTQASGFRTNATLTVSPPIPDTTTYRVWFGTRNTFQNISAVDKDALFSESMRTINNVPGEIRSLLRQVHSETSVNQAWDAPFDSTIRSLAASGLNERYRRATLQPAGFVTGDFNQAGAGAVIFRDGQAVTIVGEDFLLTNTSWPDPNHALLKLRQEDDRSADFNGQSGNLAGEYGIWHESEWKANVNAGDPGMAWRSNSSGPALIEVIPYDMRAATFDGDNLLTYIDATSATATINPDSGSGSTARRTIECGAGQHFALSTPTRTAIRLGLDLIEVTNSSGDVRTFLITELLSTTRIGVILPSGNSPLFSTTAEPGCTIRLLQVMVGIGGGLGRDSASSFVRPIIAIPPAILTDAVANESTAPCSFFGAQTGSVVDATAHARRARALEFGSTASPDAGGTVDGTLTARGWLNGDGGAMLVRLNVNSGQALITDSGNIICGDITADDITADDVIVDTFRELRPERYYHLREDWIRFLQAFAPDIIHATQSHWTFDEIADVFTLVNGTPSTKNPGQLQVVGAGGGVTRELSIRPTNLMPFSFANILSMTVVAAVTEAGGNIATSMLIGFVDNTSVQTGGSDALFLFYSPSFGWRLGHRVGGIDGPQNATVLGAHTNGQFVVVRFLKIANGDLQVYFNDSLITTVPVASLPTGLGTFNMHFLQSIGDAGATTFTVDFNDLVVDTGAVRSGAP